ncbi:MAG: transporter [Chitinophagaceae bacterium]|nr:transporter [Chitinophagaceae bacterium]
MYRTYINIIFLLITFHGFGQDQLNPDRPGESRTPELVKGYNLQAELGFRKEKIEEAQYMYQHPEVLLRFGLFNALELRVKLASQTIRDNISKAKLNGITPVYFGVKAKILPQHNWLPSIGALAEVGVPSLASGDYFVTGIPFEFRTLFNNNITNRFSIQYNVGVSWNETNNHTDNKQWMYTISPVYKINDWQLFVEQYAFLRNGTSAEHYFDGGVQYFFNKDFAIDVAAGAGLSEISSSYYIEGGLSYRLDFTR